MKQLTIDPEFRDKVPPLKPEEFEQLEENILSEGRVMVPIVTWNGTIIDGHNRYAIVQKHPEIPFDTFEMDFADRYEAIVWICKNQLGRRNLTEQDKTYLLGKQYEAQKMTLGGDRKSVGQSGPLKPERTSQTVAREHGVGEHTVRRAEEYAKGVDAIEKDAPGMKHKLLSGDINVPKSVVSLYPNFEKKEKEEMIESLKAGRSVALPKKDGTDKKRPNEGASTENRSRMSAVRAAADDLYNTEREVVYTQDDLKEEIDWIVKDFIKKAKNALTIRSTILNEPGAREKIAAVLLVAETAVKEMRGLLS